MSTFTAMEIAASGLSVQRTRMSLVASNLANIHSTRDPEFDGPYRRRELLVRSAPAVDFTEMLQAELGDDPAMAEEIAATLRAVEVAGVTLDESPPLRVHDPGHPDADEEGYVERPNISVMREMADMMAAARAYEANLATLRTLRDMASGAIEIARS